MKKKVIAYYRVSTRKQGYSGLGLDAQKAAVTEWAKRNSATILGEYTEVESGKRSDRPQLAEALSHARTGKATLVVAKLDRLARNVAFTSALMESGIDFVACDNPHATRFTIHIIAACAEKEAMDASQRTRDALAAAKKKGVKLGSSRPGHWKGRENRRGWKQGAKRAAEIRSQRAKLAYEFLLPKMNALKVTGASNQKIADWLNSQGFTTTVGKPFTDTAVWRIFDRTANANH